MPRNDNMKDLFGQAILDYQTNNFPENLLTETNISEEDEMDVAYLFRSFAEMPKIEQKALQLCKGKVLDIGCGAGSHALYLQEKNIDITAIDISEKAIEACKLRGIEKAYVRDILDYSEEKFDTLLLLMNGTGIFGKLNQISKYMTHLKSMLNEGGQILIDSSDLIYMYDQDEDGAFEIPATGYYGELTFTISYKNETEKPFDWLYLDYNTLQNAAHAHGLNCELITEGEHFDYLARLSF
ncbi:Methyltransferase domain-containing protein [Flavobacterium urocaniciphilum]|uniref:Methyltransferase domain-containing protein n=2 Tax=Flavobacterium urocaniciphilum TaxID=1299341 RepID=A0A1H9C1I8_9FLAO|nr:Methyltransferase domain-containing protein [Flavobacterium urocaniciphilum]